jgi:dTDP-4-amino-4,6-dideoxygalactose transaminase
MPKSPVLGWDSFWPMGGSPLPSVGDLPNRMLTSSGRAALHAALLQMRLPTGSGVLVPCYHCPTMVAPIVEAGLTPVYYPLNAHGLPDLDRIELPNAAPRAMFVAHFFGLARSLAAVREWCDQRNTLLVEDCAHSLFGRAGERPIGTWGDYATASLTKFLPVTEAGLLASATRRLQPVALATPSLRAQFRAVWDLVDRSRQHERLAGLTHALAPLFWLRDHRRDPSLVRMTDNVDPDDDSIRASCDMARILEQPSWISRLLYATVPTGRIAGQRRRNYDLLARRLEGAPGARLLQPELGDQSAPYVMPLLVDGAARADAVYLRLRAERMPVFRWDRLWPGNPRLIGDTGVVWSRQLLQLLCHQDLSPVELFNVAAVTRQALGAEP